MVVLSAGMVKLHLQYCVHFWHLQYKVKIDMLETAQRRAIKRSGNRNIRHKDC